MKIWINDALVDQQDANISVFDHGLLYGDGVFEGIRIYNGRIFELEAHIERLFKSAKAIALNMPWQMKELIEKTCQVVVANNLKEGYIRLIVTRGEGSLGLNPFTCAKPGLIIIASNIQLYPAEYYTKGLDIITCGTRRTPADSLLSQVKSLNYLNNIMAKIEAIQANCQEALMLNHQGFVAECTGDNIFIIKNGELATPPAVDGALEGITRSVVMRIAKEIGLVCVQCSLTRYEVYTADECFLTGTAAEVIPVVSLDKRLIGDGNPGKYTKQIMENFRAYANTSGTKIA